MRDVILVTNISRAYSGFGDPTGAVMRLTEAMIDQMFRLRKVREQVVGMTPDVSLRLHVLEYWYEAVDRWPCRLLGLPDGEDAWHVHTGTDQTIDDVDEQDPVMECHTVQVNDTGVVFTAMLHNDDANTTYETPELTWEQLEDLKAGKPDALPGCTAADWEDDDAKEQEDEGEEI